jgi:diaminohydroxyphosphoribosylaminopyrimidine deaminase/5-amino-6-(5-phosphoribosylamino)uracil reductase
MQRTETDHLHLARAIELAQLGRGHVHPNPVVGAVVVKDDVLIG